MKKIFNLLLICLTLVVLSTTAFAQTTPTTQEPVDEVTDLTFPIGELGGCGDYSSCMSYCDDPVNNSSCIEYAKQKGFYRGDPVAAPTDEFLGSAGEALGCDSATACLDFCSKEENFDSCDQFAKSQGLPGGYVDQPDRPEYLEVAQDVLGCDSAEACASFCDDTANSSQCTDFAGQVGLLGGETPVGPGGCTSEGTCQLYCSDPSNYNTCAQFAPEGGQFTGPGGCNSPESCRTHCEQNPDECRSYAPGSNGLYVPVTCGAGEYFGPGGVCTPTEETEAATTCSQSGQFWSGTACEDQAPPGVDPTVGGAYFQPRPEMGGCDTPGKCYDYCSQNPDSCPGFDSSSQKPQDGYIPTLYYTPGTEVKFAPKTEMGNCDSPGSCYDYCRDNPGSCDGFDASAPRPVNVYTPLTYYTPSDTYQYFTPPAASFYTTPMYYTPPAGSDYTTPTYYTPGTYFTPSYYTPFHTNYSTPSYYTPGGYYPSPSGSYPTPSYVTPIYYTPPVGSNYTTPNYYTPPTYTTPNYYTPFDGRYTTPSYSTPPPYSTPTYYTPYSGGTYTTPVYYTPPPGSNYTTPSYPTPSYYYPTPSYPYPSPVSYNTPSYYSPYYYTPNAPGYTTPSYYTPSYSYPTPGSAYTYPTPSYPTPTGSYSYPTPGTYYAYPTPSYPYPTPGSSYSYPSPYSYPTPGSSYSYPTPASYTYPSPSGSYSYPTPSSYSYPTPGGSYSYPSPSYPTPSYSYPTPGSYSYPSPSYGTPAYGTPTYGTPTYATPSYDYPSPSYGTPTYETPSYATPSYDYPSPYGTPTYATPAAVGGVSTGIGLFEMFWNFLAGN